MGQAFASHLLMYVHLDRTVLIPKSSSTAGALTSAPAAMSSTIRERLHVLTASRSAAAVMPHSERAV